MAISTTATLTHRYQHIGHGGFQQIFMEDDLVAGTSQIQVPLRRVLSASVSNIDGSTGGVGLIDNGDGTVTVNGVGTARVGLIVNGY